MATEADSQFVYVNNIAPQKLSIDQINEFNSRGFVSPLSGFAPSEIQFHRDYFDRLINQLSAEDAYAINCYQSRLASLWDICTHPVLLDHVEDLIGPNIICWASHFFCKLPHDPRRVPWHQDASFWHLSPTNTVTVWLAIDDTDEENSAMEFLPSSHRNGELPIKAVDGNNVLNKETQEITNLGASYSNNLRAGEFSLHADMLVHGSRPNLSDRRRCGLTIRYCPTSVRITDPVWADGIEAIICRGVDRDNYWRHHPRPLSDTLVLKDKPISVGGN